MCLTLLKATVFISAVISALGFLDHPVMTQPLGCYVVTGGTQCRTDSARLTDHVNALEYGTITFDNGYNATEAAANRTTIQAAIKFAIANAKQVVDLPCGNSTSAKIWLDQTLFADSTENHQAITGTVNDGGLVKLTVASTSGWMTGDVVQVFSVGGTTEANGQWTITLVDGKHITLQGSTYKNAYTSGGSVFDPVSTNFSIWLHGCGGLNTNLNNGTNLYFVSGLNAPYIVFGPGRGLGGDGFTVNGTQSGACWATYPSQSVGIAYAAKGSQFELDRVNIYNAYSLFGAGWGGNNTLGDHITLNNVSFSAGHYGFQTIGGEPFIMNLNDSSIGSADIIINDRLNDQINVRGGSYASGGTHANVFGISSTSSLALGGGSFQISTAVNSPDAQIAANCYTAFVINTTDFGPVPFTLVSYSYGRITVQILRSWYVNNFGDLNIASVTNLQTELRAATKLYAVQKYIVFCGQVNADGVHIEGDVPMTLWDTLTCPASSPVHLKNIILNIDPSDTASASCLGRNNACEARFLVAQTHPFLNYGNTNHTFEDLNVNQAGPPTDPIIIDVDTKGFNECYFKQWILPLNIVVRWWASNYNNDHEQYASNRYQGTCQFDRSYFPMQNTTLNGAANLARAYQIHSDNQVPFMGFRPAPWAIPELTPNQYSQVSSVGTMGTYPLIHGGTIYSIQKEGDTSSRKFVTSAHQFYSWGQNLAIKWSYLGASNWVGLSDTSQMFAGLAITLDLSGIGGTQFVVTGVYPGLGGVTVSYPGTIGAGTQGVTVSPGKGTTVYTGSTIVQQPYSWTSVTLQ
jgi:hypothetical protein